MAERQNFQTIQYAFAAHIRDPDNVPCDTDIEDRRMGIYRRLFYNNIENFISSGFPVLRKLYSDQDWHHMVRQFFIKHPCKSPYFLEISEEFLHYLQDHHEPQSCDPAFLQELAHYEWVELALSVADEEIDWNQIDVNGDLSHQTPYLSPLAWTLSYQWPVHTLGPDNMPETAPSEPTFLVVYRDRTDKVRFILINHITAMLLNLLEEHEQLSGAQACAQIAEQMQHPQPDIVIQGGLSALEDLKAKGIILGTRRT